jgi:hypothetical protein
MKFIPDAAIPAVIVGCLLGLFGLYLTWSIRRDERRNRRS